MNTHLFMALVLFMFCPGALEKLSVQGSRVGFSSTKIANQVNDLPAYSKKITNAPSNLNLWQAPGHYVFLEGDQVKKALTDMMNDAPFEQLVAHYGCKKTEKQVQVTKFKFRDQYQRQVIEYTSLGGEKADIHQMNFLDDSLPLKTHWIFEYHAKMGFTKAFVQAFYVTSDFAILSLPPEYANALRQTQVVVDTTTQFLQDQLAMLNYQLAETKHLQSSLYLLTRKAADREARRKRRQEFFSGLASWLPLLVMALK